MGALSTRLVNIKRQTKYSPPAQEILSFTSSFLPAKQPPTSVQAHHHNHGRQPEPGRAHHSVLQRHWRLARSCSTVPCCEPMGPVWSCHRVLPGIGGSSSWRRRE